MSTFTEKLTWRYATKAFDPSQELDGSKKQKILDAIRFAPTSFGLQPFRVHVVEDEKRKEAIKAAGWNQPQYTTAPLVLVFSTLFDIDQRITDYISLAAGENPELKEKLAGYEGMMRGALSSRSADEIHAWAAKQSYIALGFAMAACAELEVDSCPMEGFDPAKLNELMGFSDIEKTAVILCVGHRAKEEKPRPKVRFSEEKIFVK